MINNLYFDVLLLFLIIDNFLKKFIEIQVRIIDNFFEVELKILKIID